MVGLDTGFFVALMSGDEKATKFWSSFSDTDTLPIVSILTIGELLYISFKVGEPAKGKSLVQSIYDVTRVLVPDREIIEKAAALKAGRGIPYVDSIILATFLLSNCDEIHTTDRSHFSEIKNKGLIISFYRIP